MKNRQSIDKMYEELIERFARWAETRSDIRAAIIVGSRARIDHPADEWADLDLLLVTANPERYISAADWLENVGKVCLTFVESTAGGDEKERRALFENMLDVDFAVFPAEKVQQLLQSRIAPEMATQLLNVFGCGMRVVLDKDGMATRMQTLLSSIEATPSQPPTKQEFPQLVNDFLYHAVFTAKHLRRGELWWARTCLNCYMQRLLLQMIEWHTHAEQGLSYDTWFRGRFLEQWANPKTLKQLRETFAHYDKTDAKRSLLAVLDLFTAITTETAEKLSYAYPTEAARQVTEWIRTCLQEQAS